MLYNYIIYIFKLIKYLYNYNKTIEEPKKDNKKKSKSKKKLTDISVSDNSENKNTQNNNSTINNNTKDYNSNSQNSINNKRSSAREKKPNHKEDLGYIDARAKCKDPKLLEVAKRCDKVIQKLKKHPFAERYVQSNPDIPNLSDVERKVKLFQYNSIHTFAIDVRNVWKYYYTTAANNPELYQKTVEMTQYFEEIFSEIEDIPFETPYLDNINKKIKSIEDQLQMSRLKSNIGGVSNMFMNNNSKTNRNAVPLQEKPMTINEKNTLSNKIRMLSQDQLKGIISILSDQCSIENNSKYFEFDIDTLSTKKLRDLEKYVKKCLKNSSSKNVTPIIAKNDIEKTNEIKNNINTNNGNNSINSNLGNKNINLNNNNSINKPIERGTSIKQPHSISNNNNNLTNLSNKNTQNLKTIENVSMMDSLSSSIEDDDSGSLSSLDFKKGN